jgi:hypothetical protein
MERLRELAYALALKQMVICAESCNDKGWRGNTAFFGFGELMHDRPVEHVAFVFKEHFGEELFSPLATDGGFDRGLKNDVVSMAATGT